MNKGYWNQYKITNKKEADKLLTTDILIIGAGISGIMCAYELAKKTKQKIILVDGDKICTKTSSKTTAKITPFHNIYYNLASLYGIEIAKMYFDSQVEGIEHLLSIIENEQIDCDLEKVNNFIFATKEEGIKNITKEYQVLKEMDIDCELVKEVPIGLEIKEAIKTNEYNYTFHPLKYLDKIVQIIKNKGVLIYENYCALNCEIENKEYLINFTNGNTINAKKVIVATNYPIFNYEGLYPGKLYQEKNYLIAFRSKLQINDIYINMEKPVRSLRSHQNVNLLVGNSHIAGNHEDPSESMAHLKEFLAGLDSQAKIIEEWTNQDTMSIDYLPFIGKYANSTPDMYVISAFQTWGMSTSHVAALLLTRIILNEDNPYYDLYCPQRFSHFRSPKESIKMIGRAVDGLVLSRFTTKKDVLEDVPLNSGAIIKHKGFHYAVYNDEGNYLILKTNCTHTGCFLKWNDLETTWDCRCHGSRFDVNGNVLVGPAVKPLQKIESLD